MTKKIIIPYVAAILAMVVCISVAADDGAVVARSYAGYNNQKPSVASDNVYRPVNLSWNNTFKKVTAEEALEVKDYARASNLQLELKANMEEIQQLYVRYKKNIY